MNLYGPDSGLRAAAFLWLSRVTNIGETSVNWSQLSGFEYEGRPASLIGAKGIWKPGIAELPTTIYTAPPKAGRPAPYDDSVTDDGLLRYKYEGKDVNGYRNVWLRRCMDEEVPLIYLHGVAVGTYVAAWPALIVNDHPRELTFEVALLDPRRVRDDLSDAAVEHAESRFICREVKQRLDQAVFRIEVLQAYRHRCTLCQLQHTELLDAAHIVPYASGGVSRVPNGLSLCKIHHAAYDADIIGVRPDYVVKLRSDLLDEKDGPMLRHGLQEMHGRRLVLPRRVEDRPDAASLEQRWADFVGAC